MSKPTLRTLPAALAIAVLGGITIAGSALPASAPAALDPCSPAYPSFGVGAWPPACWRPYADSSPFNKPIPPNPALHSRSRQIVERLLSSGPPAKERVGNQGGQDFGKPIYWGRPSDPVYTVRGSDPVEGDRIHIPAGAQPANGSDGHMTIVQPDGWEYDFWRADPPSGGEVHVSTGRKTRIDGDGIGSGVVEARWGSLAGRVRAPEMQAGQINHALMISVECTDGELVWPSANRGSRCGNPADAPSLGDRFQLAMGDGEIAALPVPAWKKTILRALARYGAYVGEQAGVWGLLGFEGGPTYTSFGYPDQMAAFAASVGIKSSGGSYSFDIASGVDWNRLRVIDSAVSRSSPADQRSRSLRLTRLSVRPRKARRRRARVRFRLSRPATVSFTLLRAKRSRRTPFAGAGGFTITGKAGLNRRRLPKRVNGKRLRRGRYRLVAVATDSTGARSATKRAGFRLIRR
jgi:hypothetical protein